MADYFDTNVVIAMLTNDAHSARTAAWLAGARPDPLVSPLIILEVGTVLTRQMRSGILSRLDTQRTFSVFDAWASHEASSVPVEADDWHRADLLIRDFEMKLAAADAVHLAITRRVGARLITFDARLAAAANVQGVAIVVPA